MFFSTFVRVMTKSSREQGVELKWPRPSTPYFFHKYFEGHRKRGLKWASGVFSTANLETGKYLVATAVTQKTRSCLSKSQNNTKNDEKIRLVPGENTKYAWCWHPQIRKSPSKSSRKNQSKLGSNNIGCSKRSLKATTALSWSSGRLSKEIGKRQIQSLFLVSTKHDLTF